MFYSAICAYTRTRRPGLRVRQQGMSLLELLVGIAIGLMVVAAAFGTLVINKNTSGTVSDASVLNNQANNTLRTISFYVRQAGGLEFIRTGESTYLLDNPPNYPSFSAGDFVISGSDQDSSTPYDTLKVYGASRSTSVTRDCQGNTPTAAIAEGGLIWNQFRVTNNELVCETSLTNPTQAIPIASNVEDFQVQYLVETSDGSKSQWNSASETLAWERVTAVQICLQIRGELKQPDSMFSGTYRNCKNVDSAQDGYLRAVVRQVIQLRNRSTHL